MRKLLLKPWAKPVLFVLCSLPLAWLVAGAVLDRLGANPAEALIRGLGDWTLRFLCLTLAVTPLRVRTATPQLARFRRMLGLFTFFYGVLHLLAYAWLDKGFDAGEVAHDIAKRPFILVGFLALVLMAPLAATSWNRAIKALGAARWQKLHKLVYAVAVLAILHFLWMRSGKRLYGEVWVYGSVVALLLGERVLRAISARKAAPARSGRAQAAIKKEVMRAPRPQAISPVVSPASDSR